MQLRFSLLVLPRQHQPHRLLITPRNLASSSRTAVQRRTPDRATGTMTLQSPRRRRRPIWVKHRPPQGASHRCSKRSVRLAVTGKPTGHTTRASGGQKHQFTAAPTALLGSTKWESPLHYKSRDGSDGKRCFPDLRPGLTAAPRMMPPRTGTASGGVPRTTEAFRITGPRNPADHMAGKRQEWKTGSAAEALQCFVSVGRRPDSNGTHWHP